MTFYKKILRILLSKVKTPNAKLLKTLEAGDQTKSLESIKLTHHKYFSTFIDKEKCIFCCLRKLKNKHCEVFDCDIILQPN